MQRVPNQTLLQTRTSRIVESKNKNPAISLSFDIAQYRNGGAIETCKTNVKEGWFILSLLRKFVTPAETGAGVQKMLIKRVDSRFRGNDIITLNLLCFVIMYAGINKQYKSL